MQTAEAQTTDDELHVLLQQHIRDASSILNKCAARMVKRRRLDSTSTSATLAQSEEAFAVPLAQASTTAADADAVALPPARSAPHHGGGH